MAITVVLLMEARSTVCVLLMGKSHTKQSLHEDLKFCALSRMRARWRCDGAEPE